MLSHMSKEEIQHTVSILRNNKSKL